MDIVLPLRPGSWLFWDNRSPFASLAGLLREDGAGHLGAGVWQRLKHMRRLQDRFGADQD